MLHASCDIACVLTDLALNYERWAIPALCGAISLMLGIIWGWIREDSRERSHAQQAQGE